MTAMNRVYDDRIAVDLVRAEAMAYGDFGGRSPTSIKGPTLTAAMTAIDKSRDDRSIKENLNG